MAEKNSRRQIDRFFMNNCKIANELRKYRDLAGCLNQVSLSGERVRIPSDSADYAEYFISENLTYLDMVTANAVYTLMVTRPNQTAFQADLIGQIMAGNLGWRVPPRMRQDLEARLQKLSRPRSIFWPTTTIRWSKRSMRGLSCRCAGSPAETPCSSNSSLNAVCPCTSMLSTTGS